jgi:hypothetical protein
MRVRVLGALLAVLGVLAVGAQSALASSSAATTQAYVQANYAGLKVVISHLATSEAAPLHVLAQVQRECPGAGMGSPQDPESTQMSNEVIGTIVLSAVQPDLAAEKTFVRAVAGLSWSNGAITRSVRGYTSDLKTLVGLSVPNLCGDVKAWAADGYHSLPASTVSFAGKFMPAWVSAGFLPPQLASYESGATRALAHRCEAMEQEVAEAEARAVEHWGDIMNTLNLWP